MASFENWCGECFNDMGDWDVIDPEGLQAFLDEIGRERPEDMTREELKDAEARKLIEMNLTCASCGSDRN